MIRTPCLLLALALLPAPLLAHEVNAELGSLPVTVVSLSYGDGEAFSYEQYEVLVEGGTVPVQTGRTDARGRAAILPVPGKRLLFRVASKDGHGASLTLEATPEAAAATATGDGPGAPRWLLVLAGGGILFGLFGLLQLLLRRR